MRHDLRPRLRDAGRQLGRHRRGRPEVLGTRDHERRATDRADLGPDLAVTLGEDAIGGQKRRVMHAGDDPVDLWQELGLTRAKRLAEPAISRRARRRRQVALGKREPVANGGALALAAVRDRADEREATHAPGRVDCDALRDERAEREADQVERVAGSGQRSGRKRRERGLALDLRGGSVPRKVRRQRFAAHAGRDPVPHRVVEADAVQVQHLRHRNAGSTCSMKS